MRITLNVEIINYTTKASFTRFGTELKTVDEIILGVQKELSPLGTELTCLVK